MSIAQKIIYKKLYLNRHGADFFVTCFCYGPILLLGGIWRKRKMSEILLTILGLGFILLMTTLGGSVVFFLKKEMSRKANCLFLGFTSGLMLASSVWSLLLPSIELSGEYGDFNFLPASIGLIAGVILLLMTDRLLSSRGKNKNNNFKGLSRSGKLFLATTLHNIPEGLAVGIAFGNAFLLGEMTAFYSALWLAIAIGLQNFPEGSAVALPLAREYKSKAKAFLFSFLSGAVEPIVAVIGIFLASAVSGVMPWLLAFSAGSMLFVVIDELVPEAKSSGSHLGSWAFVAGFVVMMILDVALA